MDAGAVQEEIIYGAATAGRASTGERSAGTLGYRKVVA